MSTIMKNKKYLKKNKRARLRLFNDIQIRVTR